MEIKDYIIFCILLVVGVVVLGSCWLRVAYAMVYRKLEIVDNWTVVLHKSPIAFILVVMLYLLFGGVAGAVCMCAAWNAWK